MDLYFKRGIAFLGSLIKSKRSQIVLFIGIYVGGYVFFLSSHFFIPDTKRDRAYTPLYVASSLNQRQVRLMAASRPPGTHQLMVELEIINFALEEENIDALEIRDENFQKVGYQTLYLDEEYLVILVEKKAPVRLSLRGFAYDTEGKLETISSIVLQEGKNITQEKVKQHRGQKEIYQRRFGLEKKYLLESIARKEKEILAQEREYQSYEERIRQFRQKEAFFSEKEKERYALELANNEGRLASLLEEIEEKKEEVAELKNKLEIVEVKQKQW